MEFSHLCLLLSLFFNVSLARKRLLKVRRVYSADGSLDGLGCAIHGPYTYNAARFNTVTKTCTQLPKNWYVTGDTPLPDNNYFQLLELEILDPQGVEKLELFPAILLPYGGVVLYVTTTDNPTGQNSYAVAFMDNAITTFVDVPKTTERCFASQRMSYFCRSFSMVNPYTDYTLKYRIMENSIQAYTNNVYDVNFYTGYSKESYKRLKVIQGSGIVCNRIIFFYLS